MGQYYTLQSVDVQILLVCLKCLPTLAWNGWQSAYKHFLSIRELYHKYEYNQTLVAQFNKVVYFYVVGIVKKFRTRDQLSSNHH